MISKAWTPPTIADVWFSCALAQRVLRRRILFWIRKDSYSHNWVLARSVSPPGFRCCLWAIIAANGLHCRSWDIQWLSSPVEMINWKLMLKQNIKLIRTSPAPNWTCNIAAVEVPMSCPNFGNAMLADVFLLNCVTCQPLNDFIEPYLPGSNIDHELIFFFLGSVDVKAIWN